MKFPILLGSLAMLLCLSLHAQTDSYAVKLKKMFELSGTKATFDTAIDQTVDMSKSQYPGVDAEVWEVMRSEFKSTSMDELTEMLVPVYKKYLTEEDLDDIITFYKSRAGKKLASSQSKITGESMQIGQKWGARLGEKVMEKVEQRKN